MPKEKKREKNMPMNFTMIIGLKVPHYRPRKFIFIVDLVGQLGMEAAGVALCLQPAAVAFKGKKNQKPKTLMSLSAPGGVVTNP